MAHFLFARRSIVRLVANGVLAANMKVRGIIRGCQTIQPTTTGAIYSNAHDAPISVKPRSRVIGSCRALAARALYASIGRRPNRNAGYPLRVKGECLISSPGHRRPKL